jgi:hypothetical protein
MTSYEVTLNMDYTKTIYVHAESDDEAAVKAEDYIRRKQSSISNLGYSIGDVDVVDVSACPHPNKAIRARRIAEADRKRVYHVD